MERVHSARKGNVPSVVQEGITVVDQLLQGIGHDLANGVCAHEGKAGIEYRGEQRLGEVTRLGGGTAHDETTTRGRTRDDD